MLSGSSRIIAYVLTGFTGNAILSINVKKVNSTNQKTGLQNLLATESFSC